MAEILKWILLVVVVAGGAAIVVIGCILGIHQHKSIRQSRRSDGKAPKAVQQKTTTAMQQVYATLVDQTCRVEMIGMKTPKTVKIFTVVFQTKNGEKLTFEVPEEMYDGLEKGQHGILSYVDDSLYGFDLHET